MVKIPLKLSQEQVTLLINSVLGGLLTMGLSHFAGKAREFVEKVNQLSHTVEHLSDRVTSHDSHLSLLESELGRLASLPGSRPSTSPRSRRP